MEQKILNYSISLAFCLLLSLPLQAQNSDISAPPANTPPKKEKKEAKEEVHYPLYNGISVSVDLWGPGSKLFGSDFFSSEVAVDVNLKNRFFPIVELGYGNTDTWSDKGIHYKTGAPYFRIGMDYNANWFKNRLKGSIHLAPLAYNFLYVNRVELAGRYGIDKGKRQLHNFGSQFTIDMNWKFSDNISWKTRLYGYTTYERTELEWENTFAFRFNKWISSNIFVYPRFDDARTRDDHHGYFQYKEYASLGLSYSF